MPDGELFVQYKGTDLCADFHCTCGGDGHIDDMFVYSIKCGDCNQIWVLPHTLTLTRLEDISPEDKMHDIEYRRTSAKLPDMDTDIYASTP